MGAEKEREREREEGKREDSSSVVVVGYTAGSTSMVHRMTFPSVG